MKALFSKKSYNIIREASYGELFDPVAMEQLDLTEEDKNTLSAIHEVIIQAKRNALARYTIESADQAIDYLQDKIGFKPQEELYAIYLNVKNEIIGEAIVHRGSLNESVAHPRDILRGAIKCNASRFIVAHNHPSGNPEPSNADLRFTKKLIEAGQVCGIELLDHIVVGRTEGQSIRQISPAMFS